MKGSTWLAAIEVVNASRELRRLEQKAIRLIHQPSSFIEAKETHQAAQGARMRLDLGLLAWDKLQGVKAPTTGEKKT